MCNSSKRYVSEIFEEKPIQWGLRGDPFFWNDLKEYFSDVEFPYYETNLVNDITRLHKEITGRELVEDNDVYVERYNHGGMSSGIVCGEFWIKRAMPLLIKRYREICNEEDN